jgi:hypothetical protein
MEIVMTTVSRSVSMGRLQRAAMLAIPPIQVRLPAGGWRVGFRVQADGRTVVEVTDQDGALAGLATSSRLPILSINVGWSGRSRAPRTGRQRWALAIGHVPAGDGQPAVTFVRRTRNARRGRTAVPADAVDGLWVAHDGLWVAAATGHYTLVRLATHSTARVKRLRPVTAWPAATGLASAGWPGRR